MRGQRLRNRVHESKRTSTRVRLTQEDLQKVQTYDELQSRLLTVLEGHEAMKHDLV